MKISTCCWYATDAHIHTTEEKCIEWRRSGKWKSVTYQCNKARLSDVSNISAPLKLISHLTKQLVTRRNTHTQTLIMWMWMLTYGQQSTQMNAYKRKVYSDYELTLLPYCDIWLSFGNLLRHRTHAASANRNFPTRLQSSYNNVIIVIHANCRLLLCFWNSCVLAFRAYNPIDAFNSK